MFLKLLLLLIVVPLVELLLLLVISQYFLNWYATFALVVVTGIVGAWLAQWQGTRAFGRIRNDLAAGQMPTEAVTDAVLIFIAGAFLMTPGILTDIAGFTLLVPAGRRLVKHFVMRWFKAYFKIESATAGGVGRGVNSDSVIDSYAVDPPAGEEASPGG